MVQAINFEQYTGSSLLQESLSAFSNTVATTKKLTLPQKNICYTVFTLIFMNGIIFNKNENSLKHQIPKFRFFENFTICVKMRFVFCSFKFTSEKFMFCSRRKVNI